MDRIILFTRMRAGIFFSFFLVWPVFCEATFISLEPAELTAAPGQKIEVDVLVDTEDECINALEIALVFDPGAIVLTDFSRGGSVLTFWTEFPDKKAINQANSSGTLVFSGGMPGGYCSRVIQGVGKNDLVARLVFSVPDITVGRDGGQESQIRVADQTRAYLHDGQGSEQRVSSNPAIVKIENGAPKAVSEWETDIRADRTPPEAFSLDIQRSDEFFDGKYFATFFTTDKQTGIDYYEIREENTVTAETSGWEKQESPYVLKDQTLGSSIRVRAFDKAGNVTEASYVPQPREEKRTGDNWKKLLIAAIALLILSVTGLLIYLSRRKHLR